MGFAVLILILVHVVVVLLVLVNVLVDLVSSSVSILSLVYWIRGILILFRYIF